MEEDTELAATLELEFCCGEELAQLLLAVLLPLFRGVAPADAEMLFALWPIVPLSQSLPLLVAVPVAAGALVLSLRLGVAISAVCTAFRFCWFSYFRSPSLVTFTTAHSSVYPTSVFLLSRFAIFFWVFPLGIAIALVATTHYRHSVESLVLVVVVVVVIHIIVLLNFHFICTAQILPRACVGRVLLFAIPL